MDFLILILVVVGWVALQRWILDVLNRREVVASPRLREQSRALASNGPEDRSKRRPRILGQQKARTGFVVDGKRRAPP